MGTTAARHSAMIIKNSRTVLAIEAICAAQAADIRGAEKLAPKTRRLHSAIREVVPLIDKDRVLSKQIESLSSCLKEKRFVLDAAADVVADTGSDLDSDSGSAGSFNA